MDRALILETTFLIDLDREERRGEPGPATAFLELASAPSSRDRDKWEAFLTPLCVLAPTPDICWQYGRIYRHLKNNGQLIGTNDLWIASSGELPRI